MTDFKFVADATTLNADNACSLAIVASLVYEPEDKIRDKVSAWGFDYFKFFDGKKTGTQGFLASKADMILLAFRGTEATKIKDVGSDAKIRMKPELTDVVAEGKAHRGFQEALDDVWQDVLAEVRTQQQSQVRPLWVTGHSLGAALATMATARLALAEQQAVQGLYNFGSPRVFNTALAEAFDQQLLSKCFRFVNNNDIVTRIPSPIPTLAHLTDRYRHIGQLSYFDESGKFRPEITSYSWDVFKDHLLGRAKDLGEAGTDGLKDHFMNGYISCCEKMRG